MIEPLRSQYLAALGIENYVPRFILPGAKLSGPCEWLEVPAALADSSAPPDASAVAEPPPLEKNASHQSAGDIAQRAPIIEPTVRRPVRADESTPVKSSAASAETGPQFALSVAITQGRILLIDDATSSNAQRSAYQTMMANMLSAIRPAAAQLRLETFVWPSRLPRVARDADAARESLSAYLQKLIDQNAIDTVLVLGDVAQQWCGFGEGNIRIVKSGSLLACVQDPALKRPLWHDIRHLAEK